MASWNYEKEQERLLRFFDEVQTSADEGEDSDSSLEEDHLEYQDENTDSEQEMSEEESEKRLQPSTRKLREPSFIVRDGTRWKKHLNRNLRTRTRSCNIVTQLPGVKGVARHKKTPMEIWSLFITDEMLEKIVFYSNLYIEQKRYPEQNRTARPTKIDELKALLGLLYISGVMKSNHRNITDLFRNDGMGVEIFRLTMSLERFKFLLRNIRLDNKITRPERQKFDKLAAVREFFDEFNGNLPKYFSLSQFATIDEMLWAFRGRCGFRVYIPSKPNKYGLKIYALTDSKMFYTAKLEIYIGQQPIGPYKQDTSNISLVPRLCEPIWGSKRNITIDNFFTSTALTNTLLIDHQLTVIGTLRKNKPQIPEEMKIKRPEKSIMFAFQEEQTLVSYIPRKNKNVFVLSSMHHDDSIDYETGKPEIIIDYNKTKGGVDTVDKLCASYDCARITRRWPMVIFFGALNLAGINSFIILKQNNVEKMMPRRLFIENLGYQLLESHVKKRRLSPGLPRTIKLRILEIYNISDNDQTPRNPTRGRCYYCSSNKNRKTRFSCRKCKKFMCLEHLTPICSECVANIE